MDSNVVNNFVKVSQEHTHVVVKGAGGLQGLPGPAGAGLKIDGSVDTYSELPHHLVPEDAGVAYFVQEDGLLYVWSGTKWPEEGEGAQFQGPRGVQGIQGEQGVPGEPGADGEPGPRGPEGFSPTVTTEDIEAGIRINITNRSGTTSTDIDYRTIPDGVITTSKLNDSAVTTSKIAAGAVTTAKIGSGAVTDTNIDWSTFDTGWLDCPYASGYTTTSNTEWPKLQARICGKMLYLRGGVSPTGSGRFTVNTEVKVASLPDSIKTIFVNKAAGCHYQSCGRCASSGLSLWTILGSDVGLGNTGDISVITGYMLGGATTGPRWASAGLFAIPLY